MFDHYDDESDNEIEGGKNAPQTNHEEPTDEAEQLVEAAAEAAPAPSMDENLDLSDEEIAAAADPDFEKQLVAELEAKEAEEAALEAESAAEETAETGDEPRSGKKSKFELSDEQRNYITAAMETLIFMSDRPLSLPKLRQLIDDRVPLNAYREMIAKLKAEFAAEHRGVELAELSLGFQLRTKPHMSQVLRKMVKATPLKLTPAMMEVMAVVAYRQPVTKDDLDQIRGVDCSYLLRSLMDKRLIRITGRSELPGRPMLYGTTHEFLELFNLKDIESLPPLHEIESMVAASEVGIEEKEKEQLENFGRMVEASHGTVLFDDSMLDTELEEIRRVIESVSTSTEFIDEQKAQERLAAKVEALKIRGLTLDADGKEVPLDSPEGQAGEEARRAAVENLRQRMLEAATRREEARAAEQAAADQDVAVIDTAIVAVEEAVEEVIEATANTELPVVADETPELEEAPSEIVLEATQDVREMSEEFLAIGDEDAAEQELAVQEATQEATEDAVEHTPSDELVAAAEQATADRHAEMLAETQAEIEAEAERLARETTTLTEAHNIDFEGLKPLEDDESEGLPQA